MYIFVLGSKRSDGPFCGLPPWDGLNVKTRCEDTKSESGTALLKRTKLTKQTWSEF